MIPNWLVTWYDTDGNTRYRFAGRGGEEGGLTQIILQQRVNHVGNHSITFAGDLDFSDVIDVDWLCVVEHRPIGITDWYVVYAGLHRTAVWRTNNSGLETFTGYGFDLKHLLQRRVISDYVGSSGAFKIGLAETVAKEYIDENCGSSAIAARQFPRFSVDVDGATGLAWAGDRAKKNLLEVVQEIAGVAGGDFDVVIVPGSDPMEFQFVWYDPQQGDDRTLGNVAGNQPVVFSVDSNNMLIPIFSNNRSSEVNVYYVLGQNQGAARDVAVVLDPDASYNDSPWNRLEAARQALNDLAANLEDQGLNWLDMTAGEQRKQQFQVLQTPDMSFGKEFFLGDTVTGIYRQQINKRIAGYRFNITANGENLMLTLADVR